MLVKESIIFENNISKDGDLSKYSINKQIIKILNFPRISQSYTYDCGAASFQLVMTYYGIYKREEEFLKILKTVPVEKFNNGTKLSNIKKASEYYGFNCDIKNNLTPQDLCKYIDKDIPVIVLLQAWRLKEEEDWSKSYDNGHYVVAIGYTEDKIIFEDPYSFTRDYLTFDELKERWHAVDDNGKPSSKSVSVIIYGEPLYDGDIINHME